MKNNERGFIKIVLLVIIGLLVLKYMYSIDVLGKIYEFVVEVWNKYGHYMKDVWNWLKATL